MVIRQLFQRTTVRLCLIVWCFGFVLIDIGTYLLDRSAPGETFLIYLPLIGLGTAISLALSKLLDHLATARAPVRWGLMILAAAMGGVFLTAVDTVWLIVIALTILPHWYDVAFTLDPQPLMFINILYTWTLALSVAVLWATRAFDAARMNEERAAAFESAALRAEVTALRLQLNPHFLFNALNGIASLVLDRRVEEADEMIGRLADFLRSSLSDEPEALVPLKQELDTIRAYLSVEEARFGERLQVTYAIDPSAENVTVPNFLLQPLVENSVKYGVSRTRRGGHIQITARRGKAGLEVSVVNRTADGSILKSAAIPPSGNGIGLSNTRKRLQSFYGDEAELTAERLPDGFRCEICLPAVELSPPSRDAAPNDRMAAEQDDQAAGGSRKSRATEHRPGDLRA